MPKFDLQKSGFSATINASTHKAWRKNAIQRHSSWPLGWLSGSAPPNMDRGKSHMDTSRPSSAPGTRSRSCACTCRSCAYSPVYAGSRSHIWDNRAVMDRSPRWWSSGDNSSDSESWDLSRRILDYCILTIRSSIRAGKTSKTQRLSLSPWYTICSGRGYSYNPGACRRPGIRDISGYRWTFWRNFRRSGFRRIACLRRRDRPRGARGNIPTHSCTCWWWEDRYTDTGIGNLRRWERSESNWSLPRNLREK